MGYDPKKHNRRSIRLKGYDYSSPGEYFVTICTQNRECLFGEIVNGEMELNEFGRIARDEWLKTESIRPNVVLDLFVVMPNHMHAILGIAAPLEQSQKRDPDNSHAGAYRDTPPPNIDGKHQTEFRSPSKTLGAIVRGYKSTVTKQINQMRNTPGKKLWQRNYYEHIIRNEQSLERIRNYIINNPAKWKRDRNNPKNY